MMLLLPLTTLASAATYKGTGSAFFPKTDNKYPCTEVFMQFKVTAKKFKLIQGGYQCHPLVASFDPFELDIKDGELYENGIKVGDISKQELNLMKYDPEDDSNFHLQLKYNGKNLEYSEVWTVTSVIALEIKAVLAKESP